MPTDTMWRFANTSSLEEVAFNASLKKFQTNGMDGLVREAIQNSLDARLDELDAPVEVIIQSGEMESHVIPDIASLRSRINSLIEGNEYAKETISHMKDNMMKDSIPYISFEDKNTKGLTGAQNAPNYSENDTWEIYAYQKGVHGQTEDRNFEKTRGGSHGIGKIAFNAASDIYLIFFSNCDISGNKHIGGNIQLIEHKYEGEYYRSSGYFANINDDGNKLPYPNNFSHPFVKDTRGLKLIVPFLRGTYPSDTSSIIRSVCDNFFLAILNQKLIISVNEKNIDHNSIFDFLSNPNIYEQDIENMKKNFTPLYINSYKNNSPIEIEIEDKQKHIHKFFLYLQHEERIKKARIAIVRNIGMKIEDRNIKGHSSSSFSGVLIPASDKEDAFLKSLENESHSQLSYEHINKKELLNNAKRFINNMDKKISSIIEEKIKEQNPPDGKIDTDDLLYTVETSFKNKLTSHFPTATISEGKSKTKRILVKAKTNKYDMQDEEIEKEEKKRKKKGAPRDNENGNNEKEKTANSYIMPPETIKRAVLQDNERLFLDLSKQKKYQGVTSCNLLFKTIDGAGKEASDFFRINELYDSIFDKNRDKFSVINNEKIENISIKDGRVSLNMKFKKQANTSLKFIYFVEVTE